MTDVLPLDSPTNAAEFTVSELSGALKRSIEDAFGNVRVRGEISGYRGPHSSGHAYFSLKDDRARIEAVIWKSTFARLKFRPEEGMEVIARGRLTTYPGSSKYQIVIESLEPAGAGALMALLEERKRKLAAEGLFEESRKRALPFMPCVIGVVTSPTGAVIRDIIHRISDRFPVHVVVWPVRVQGETTGAEVSAAIRGFNECAFVRPDIIVVARGGGSLEDLWGFNDEAVVRAAAASAIPIISAVGHETDWTLIDLAADRRAPTPTGAAEMAVPVKADLEAELARLAARLKGCMSRHLDRRRQSLQALARMLPAPDQLFAMPRRRFDEAAGRLDRAADIAIAGRRQRFAGIRLSPETLARRLREHSRHLALAAGQLDRAQTGRLSSRRERLASLRLSPETLLRRTAEHRRRFDRDAARVSAIAIQRRIAANADSTARLAQRADAAFTRLVERASARLVQAARLSDSLSYRGILQRGFALVTRPDGSIVRQSAETHAGEAVALNFADGAVDAVVGATAAGLRRPAPRAKPSGPSGQGSLF
jgi:exodeoxyribonuclease VII large subunit